MTNNSNINWESLPSWAGYWRCSPENQSQAKWLSSSLLLCHFPTLYFTFLAWHNHPPCLHVSPHFYWPHCQWLMKPLRLVLAFPYYFFDRLTTFLSPHSLLEPWRKHLTWPPCSLARAFVLKLSWCPSLSLQYITPIFEIDLVFKV